MMQTFIFNLSLWHFVKIALIILLSMYFIFALIVVRQVKLMTDTLQLGYEGFISLLGYAHLIFAAFVLLAAIIIL